MNTPDEPLPQSWPEVYGQRLDDFALKLASGPTVFSRGKAYAAAGAVEVVGEDPPPRPALRARVAGSEIYQTELWIDQGVLAGSCDCPHALGGSFCKHQVAVALVWRTRLTDKVPGIDEGNPPLAPAASDAVPTEIEQRRALNDFLLGQEKAVLAERMLNWADRDPDIARELEQWVKLSQVRDDQTELRRLIAEILAPVRDFVAWDDSGAYAHHAAAVLPLLQRARAWDAGAAVDLGVHALRRVWAVLMQADDSNGEIGSLCQAIGAELVQAVQAAGPQPAGFGETYLQLQLEEPFACFEAETMEAAMGPAALARYRAVLAASWRAAKDTVLAVQAEHAAKAAARKGRLLLRDRSAESATGLWSLERMHLAQLEAAGDVDGMLAVLREDLSTAAALSTVVDFLERHGRFGEAFAQAEAGLKAHPDNRRIQDDMLRCYEREGRTEEALGLRRQQFEREPGEETFRRALLACKAAGHDVDALRLSLFDQLKARELQALDARHSQSTEFGALRRRSTAASLDVSLRAAILCSEGRWEEACALVQAPAVCDQRVLHRIALHLPGAANAQAVELLLRVFDIVIDRSASPHREALALVGEIGQRMDPAARAAWLAQLRTEHRAKRNFVRDLLGS